MERLKGLITTVSVCMLTVCIGWGCSGPVTADGEWPPEAELAPSRGSVSPEADRLLQAMGSYLKATKDFEFTADVTYDALVTGEQMVQYGGRSQITVSKPGRIHAAYDGDERRTRVYFNGETFTAYNLDRNVYAVAQVPPRIDDAVDHIVDTYGFTVPVADFVYTDPYEVMIANVNSGFVVGTVKVDGTPCHHLAFAQDNIDWQIWIQEGPHPVPRKLVITYKDSPGSPQYTARLSNWNNQPVLTDATFEFIAPPDADEIDLLPLAEREAE